MLLQDLPYEVICNILVFLGAPDVERLSRACSILATISNDNYLWKQMAFRRFPDSVPEEHYCWRTFYVTKATHQLSAAKEMDITHLHLPYWHIRDTAESRYGATAKLHSVCPFSVKGVIDGVMPGKYRMQWRMRLSLPARWNEPTDFVALPESRKGVPLAEAVRYTTPPDLYRREDVVTDTWVQITLPSVIEIREAWGFTQVRVSHEKDSAFYKSGLELDWVRLVPAESCSSTDLVIHHESQQASWRYSSTTPPMSDETGVVKWTQRKFTFVVDMGRAILFVTGVLWKTAIRPALFLDK